MMSEIPERYRCYKPKEVADAVRIIPDSTLRQKAKAGEIPHHLGPKNSLWFTIEDIDEILSTLHRPVNKTSAIENLGHEATEINPFRTTTRPRTAHRTRV